MVVIFIYEELFYFICLLSGKLEIDGNIKGLCIRQIQTICNTTRAEIPGSDQEIPVSLRSMSHIVKGLISPVCHDQHIIQPGSLSTISEKALCSFIVL